MAQQYLHRARMFRNTAIHPSDYSNGEQNLPRYALLTHAIELSLKAFVLHSVATGQPSVNNPSNHDLRGWYKLARTYGLPHEQRIERNIEELHERCRLCKRRPAPRPPRTCRRPRKQ